MKYSQLSAPGASALAIFEFRGTAEEISSLFGINLDDFRELRLVQPQTGHLDFDQFLLLKVAEDIYEGHFHGGYGVARALHEFLAAQDWEEVPSQLSLISSASSPLALRLLATDKCYGQLTDAWRQRLLTPPRIALFGPPNAGKSTLFNAWVSENRVTVSEHLGTTRDFVEVPIMLGAGDDAIAATLIDTAGLLLVDDQVQVNDVAAVEMSLGLLDEVDECIWVLDHSTQLTSLMSELLLARDTDNDLLFINRCDLPRCDTPTKWHSQAQRLDMPENKQRCATIEIALFEKWGAPLPEQVS